MTLAEELLRIDARELAVLEARRDGIKAYNASCRRGAPNPVLLDHKMQRDLEVQASIDWLNENGSFRGYVLQNLGQRIKRLREKVEKQSVGSQS